MRFQVASADFVAWNAQKAIAGLSLLAQSGRTHRA